VSKEVDKYGKINKKSEGSQVDKQTIYIGLALKSTNASRVHYAAESAQGTCWMPLLNKSTGKVDIKTHTTNSVVTVIFHAKLGHPHFHLPLFSERKIIEISGREIFSAWRLVTPNNRQCPSTDVFIQGLGEQTRELHFYSFLFIFFVSAHSDHVYNTTTTTLHPFNGLFSRTTW